MPERKTISFTAGGHLQDLTAFHYSKAIASSGTVGNEQTLDPFLVAPRKMFPGTSMPVSLCSCTQDRADVIA
jgi:cytochrome c2